MKKQYSFLYIGFSALAFLSLSACSNDDPVTPEVSNVTLADVPNAAECQNATDILLTNAKVLTVDETNPSATSIYIEDGLILAVDDTAAVSADACRIDLEGRTVIPGLYDNHAHFVDSMFSPGYYFTDIETAESTEELLTRLTERTQEVPEGALITALGAIPIHAPGLGGLPTSEQLTAAAPNNPVYLAAGFPMGPMSLGVTNEQGRQLLNAAMVPVNPDGTVNDALARQALFMSQQNSPDALLSAVDYMAFANSVGITAVGESGVMNDIYQPLMALRNAGRLTVKMRLRSSTTPVNFANPQELFDPFDMATNSWKAINEAEALLALIGEEDSMLKFNGIGEWSVSGLNPPGMVVTPIEDIVTVWSIAAARGWSLEQHAVSANEIETYLTAMEQVSQTIPLADLHWTLADVNELSVEQLSRLNNLGVGMAPHNVSHFRLSGQGLAPPISRSMIDSGANLATGSNSSNLAPLNPWLNFYHFTTGLDIAGDQVIPSEQLITREEVLKIFTLGSAWMSKEENEIGSIEVGKLADIAVLDRDILEVSDSDLIQTKSLLTLVDGKMVYINTEL